MRRVKNQDILSMKLMHYFIVDKNYKPIIINGIQDEIWLENDKEEYKVVRIVLNKIINKEQFELDIYKTRNILSQIKRKTLSISMKVLSFYMYIDEDLNINDFEDEKLKYVRVNEEKDIYESELIKKEFKDIESKMVYEEKDTELFSRLVSDISEKNTKESEKSEKMFNKKNNKALTITLLSINIIIFIVMCFLSRGVPFLGYSFNNRVLKLFGAYKIDWLKAGDYYRLITCAFVHINLLHIICNMYSLYVLGQNIEYFYGKLKFLLIYFYSAIVASLFVVIFGGSAITAGASGAIFGLLGALLYFGYSYKGYLGNKIISSTMSVIILNLLFTFASPGISKSAHIGGLLGGLAISYMLGIKEDESKASKISGTIIVLVLTGFLVYLAFFR